MSQPTSTTPDPVEVHVAGADRTEAAQLLLKAARDLDYPVESVATMTGGFLVPAAVARAAGALGDGDAPVTAATSTTLTQSDQQPAAAGASSVSDSNVASADAIERGSEQLGEHTGDDDSSVRGPADNDVTGTTLADGEPAPGGGSTDGEVLRGEALDTALRHRGLPLTGSADEKRQRVAEYDAAHPAGTTADDGTGSASTEQ